MTRNPNRLVLAAYLILLVVCSCKTDEDENNSIGGKIVKSIFIEPKGHVFTLPVTRIGSSDDGWNYFATLGGGVARNKTSVDGISSASTYEAPWAGMPWNSIYALYIEPVTGNQWIGTAAGAAYHTGTETKKNWTVYTTLNGLINDYVLAIAGDTDGNMWFGTANGVSHFNQGTWVTYR